MGPDPPEHDPQALWQTQPTEPMTMSIDEIRSKADQFRQKIWRRNLRELVAALTVVGAFGAYAWRDQDPMLRVGDALVIAGAVWVTYRLFRRGSARAMPGETTAVASLDFYRQELSRQRDLLRGVWWWYLAPMVPGLLIRLIATAAAFPAARVQVALTGLLCAAMFFAVGAWNARRARTLQEQIDALPATRSIRAE